MSIPRCFPAKHRSIHGFYPDTNRHRHIALLVRLGHDHRRLYVSCGQKIFPRGTRPKGKYSEYTLRVFGCGDARREATFFTVHLKHEKIQRIHAPCIRVRGRAERSYFLYCPPKTQEDTANTRSVYSGAGTHGEKLLSLLSTKNKRRYSEYTLRVRVRERAERSYFLYCPPKTREDTANTRTVYSGSVTHINILCACPDSAAEQIHTRMIIEFECVEMNC